MTLLREPLPARRSDPDQLPVLYVIACGSPVAGHVGVLISLAQRAGWRVCVVATPEGRRFLDVAAVTDQTGYPVRCRYKDPGDVDVLPPADAIVVAPATVNTVNKWACGIADTLALGLLVEGYGLGLPIVAMPYTNTAMAAHPAFRESLARLRSWGVRVLFGEDVVVLPPPGAGAGQAAEFPWRLALSAVGPPRSAQTGPSQAGWESGADPRPRTGWTRRGRADGYDRLSSPAGSRTAAAALRLNRG